MKHADIKSMMAEIAPVIKEFTANAISPLMERIADLERQMADIPAPETPGAISEEQVRSIVHDAIEAIPAPEDGKDADPEEVAALVKSEVERAVSALPVPQDGKSVTVDDVAPLVEDCVAKAVTALPKPKDGRDGLDLKDMFRAEGGHLLAVMSDGTTRDLGVVAGKDGEAGKDGIDGVGFDDMDLVETDNGLALRFTKGEVVKEWPLPIPLDRGVWKPGTYGKGSFVTWGGSGWIAQEDTEEKPDGGKGWRLAVKKGRDGKDATSRPDAVKIKGE